MRRHNILSFIFMLFYGLPPAISQQNKLDVNGTWNGSVSYFETFTGMTGTSERHVDVTIVQNKVTGSHSYKSEGELGGIHGTTNCQGIEGGELHIVTIRKWDSTYDIHIESPVCTGTSTGVSGPIPYGPEQKDIIISNKKYANPNLLSGSETTVSDLPGDMGRVTKTIKWNLTNKPIEAELIVTPGDYDNWKPEPGKDELTKGTVMTITLKLQGKDGKPLKVKAKSFELRLSNTSKEPGITINYPVSLRANQLPDLRFLPTNIAESVNEDQFISITCNDGFSGKVNIASYDGGGYTTLTAEAILEDKTRIEGHLLVPGGKTEIPIPKRDNGSVIASAWLKANGNPGDMDDKETSDGNNYNGDGLTAYEEYRGVISQSKFKRLDPKVKEVGVDVIKPELPFFAEGIKWFEKATGLKAIIFHEDLEEIGLDRRLNKNGTTNHDYDQYALRLYKSVIPKKGVMGKAYGGPGTPAKTFAVVIDNNSIIEDWQNWQNYAKELSVPITFTLKEFIANIIAHEMGHGVCCWHHGESGSGPQNVNALDTLRPFANKIFDIFGREITTRPYLVKGYDGVIGNQESGDIFCIMTYNPYCKWAYSVRGTVGYFFQVPIIPPGNKICNSASGTSINRSDPAGNSNYFGNANVGNCLAQINLKN